MARRKVGLLPDIRVHIPLDSAYCAYQTGGVVVRIPDLQRNLRHLAAAGLCEVTDLAAMQEARSRVDDLKGEISQGVSNTGRCQFKFPNTERLLGHISQATRSGLHDTAYEVSRDLVGAVFSDLASKPFQSGVEKQMEAEAQAQAEATQRERDMAVWREEVRRARVEKSPEPPVPARWTQFYAVEEEAPRKRGRPWGSAPLSRRPGAEA